MKNIFLLLILSIISGGVISCNEPIKLANTDSACKAGHIVDLKKSGSSIHVDRGTMTVTSGDGTSCDCDLVTGVTIKVTGDKVGFDSYSDRAVDEPVSIDTKESVFIAGMVKPGGGGSLTFIGIDDVRGSEGLVKNDSLSLESDSTNVKSTYTPKGKTLTFTSEAISFQFDGTKIYKAESKSGGVRAKYKHKGSPASFASAKEAEKHYNTKVFY